MKNDYIIIKNAKVHNLKNVSVKIPRNKLVVITGVSGSGKSSLAFDTLYAEGQRRYVESLSSYARQFLGIMDKPDVEKIEGISPAISIDQRKAVHNPRSTVGTVTEIYDYLRLLFAKVGKPYCPSCGKLISCQPIEQILKRILKLPDGSEIIISSPVVRLQKGEHKTVLEEIKKGGYVRVRVDGIIYTVEQALERVLDRNKVHDIEIVIDNLIIDKNIDKKRLKDSLRIGLRIGKGLVMINDFMSSIHFACDECRISLSELEPRLFSFNNPYGACSGCTGLGEKLEVDSSLVMPNPNLTLAEGAIIPWMKAFNRAGRQSHIYQQLSDLAKKYKFSLNEPVGNLSQKVIDRILYGDGDFEGVVHNLERRYHETDSDWTRKEIEQYMIVRQCPECSGKRLKPEVLAVRVGDCSIDQLTEMNIGRLKNFFEKFSTTKISEPIKKEILDRCNLLIDVGLDYLTLERKASTLSGGEEQRIKLSIQIGSKLTGVLYVLDEPSIGLHPRDQKKLIDTLKRLRDFGNTVVVVEHDIQTIKSADWIIDVGPGAGKYGGKITFEGTAKQLIGAKTLTGKYLSGKLQITSCISQAYADLHKPGLCQQNYLTIKNAQENNLKNIDVKIPLAKFVCITGVSGSGKSSLLNDILAKALLKKFYRAKDEPGKHGEILGIESLNKVVLVDQSPIGRTPRSNPATYTGAFSYIRDLFVKTKEARARNYSSGLFSFNVKGGRCEACEGQGQVKIEMYFMPDVYTECKECGGKRYSKEALEIEYNGKNISEVLEMTIEEASKFFKQIPGLSLKLKTLKEVGLSYIELGQPAPSLSGGEAQRIKLATELSRKSYGKTLYILDEPTTGLHLDDINKLIKVLRELSNKGNTVISIEHNPEFIKCTDWVIDLGPEGGDKGGYIVAQGTPRDIARNKKSYTGKYLKI